MNQTLPPNTNGPDGAPNVELFTRNGFAGPLSTLIRGQYCPPYTSVSGSYRPHRYLPQTISDEAFEDPRALPISLLEGEGVSVEFAKRSAESPYAYRNVFADEIHYVLTGTARLETDFGAYDVKRGDIVLLPRAVSYRFAEAADLAELLIVTRSQMELDPEHTPHSLNIEKAVDVPDVNPGLDRGAGEHEVLVRHGQQFTSYVFDFDPLTTLAVDGPPIVQRFNISDFHGLGPDAGPMPCRMFNDQSTNTLVYYLGSRPDSQRPPIHHNADYDEVILYVDGPGHYGAVSSTGTFTHTPKGLVHHGPSENVAEGYQAILLETRASLTPTANGRDVSEQIELALFDKVDSLA